MIIATYQKKKLGKINEQNELKNEYPISIDGRENLEDVGILKSENRDRIYSI